MNGKIALFISESVDDVGDSVIEILLDPPLPNLPYTHVCVFLIKNNIVPRIEVYSASYYNISAKNFQYSSSEKERGKYDCVGKTSIEIFSSIGYKLIHSSSELD
jgi:hypothetical protein